jgi:hypothetical protein
MSDTTALSKDDPVTHGLRLMLLSCVSECTSEKMAELHKLAAGFSQWDFFGHLVAKNRVFPTVYRGLSHLDGVADSKVLHMLQVRCERNTLAAMKLMAELTRIARRFDQKKIRMISLKGPSLGLALYGDLSLRVSKDLDLLVSPRDVDAAEQVLISMGYAGYCQTARFTPRQRRYLLEKGHHFGYVSADGVEVELHWRYADDHSVDFDEVWAGRKSITTFGERVDLLGDEESFLFLIYHGSRHGWKRLRWLLDVREIAIRDGLDWTSVRTKAQMRGMTHMLEQAFILLNWLFDMELPKELEGVRIDNSKAINQARRAVELISSADDLCELPNHECYLTFKEYLLGLNRTPRVKLHFLLSHFLPGPIEFQAVCIQDRYFWLYYLVRLVLQLKRIIRREEVVMPYRKVDALVRSQAKPCEKE